jgi:hypothetical protein
MSCLGVPVNTIVSFTVPADLIFIDFYRFSGMKVSEQEIVVNRFGFME